MTDLIDDILEKTANIKETPDAPAPEVVATTEPKEASYGEQGQREAVTSGENANPEKRQIADSTRQPEGKEEALVPSWLLREKAEEARQLKNRLDELERLKQQTQQQPPQIPDRDTEYDKWLEHNLEQTKSEVQRLKEERAVESVDRTFAAAAQQFSQQQPDYLEASTDYLYKHVQSWKREGFSDAQIQDKLQEGLRVLTLQAMQKGINPAQHLYEQALIFGYQKPQPAPAPVKKEPDIKRLAEAQKKNQSLTGTSGATESEIPAILKQNALDIALLPKDEFKKYEEARQKILKRL